MAKVRQILNAVSVETAKRKRICYRKRGNHEIVSGEKCLVVKEPNTSGGKNYCRDHASEILDRAQEDLSALKDQLGV
jgi:hypothetical protein